MMAKGSEFELVQDAVIVESLLERIVAGGCRRAPDRLRTGRGGAAVGHRLIETVMGAVVLAVAALFLVFAWNTADLRPVEGYTLRASFASVGGLALGSDVRIGGVKVGSVTGQRIDPESYRAEISFTVRDSLVLAGGHRSVRDQRRPAGRQISAAGSRRVEAAPGARRHRWSKTRDALALEELLARAIFLLAEPPRDAGGGGNDDRRRRRTMTDAQRAMESGSRPGEQGWDPDRYARQARFVADLGMPVVELLAPQKGEKILDLGCGDGALTLKLREMGVDVTGVDASAPQIEAARALGLDARVMDGQRLDLPARSLRRRLLQRGAALDGRGSRCCDPGRVAGAQARRPFRCRNGRRR